MRTKDILTIGAVGAGVLGAGMLVYGALVESNRLVVERLTLRLPHWPERLAGTKIAVLADLHVKDKYSARLAKRAVLAALDESPDYVVLPGDLVGYWKPDSPWLLEEVLEPLLLMEGDVLASPGNHEFWNGNPEILRIILDQFSIKMLRNENYRHEGITWVGVDSANRGEPDLEKAFEGAEETPRIVLWHEPDVVDQLPAGCALMISGHSHGGQFIFPGGYVPMTTRNGKQYRDGFYPDASTPIYVSRGIGTTGPPSRFLCPPTVGILTIETAQS